MKAPTVAQWALADSYLPHAWTPCQDAGEVWCVLDAIADDDDPVDGLEEYRMWRTPMGRRTEAENARADQ